jgi:DNA-binding YbaB/EbfC family protein
MGNLGNLNKIMKQAQEMQAKVARVQEELAAREIEATAGGGAVTVRMNGKQEVIAVRIRPDAVDPEDVALLEDLLVAALREARQEVETMMETEMKKVTGGLGFPGL